MSDETQSRWVDLQRHVMSEYGSPYRDKSKPQKSAVDGMKRSPHAGPSGGSIVVTVVHTPLPLYSFFWLLFHEAGRVFGQRFRIGLLKGFFAGIEKSGACTALQADDR